MIMLKWMMIVVVGSILIYQFAFSQQGPKVYTDIDPKDAFGRLAEFQVIDVREPEEWNDGHIKEATLIPLGTLTQKLSQIDQKKPVLVVCRSGRRSANASKILGSQGFQVFNLNGGMIKWQSNNLPVMR
jgi:rhodanese-related sulfurtransferase